MGFNNGYESGYEDAKAESAAKIKALEVRIAELEALLDSSGSATETLGSIWATSGERWEALDPNIGFHIYGRGLSAWDGSRDTIAIMKGADGGYVEIGRVPSELIQYDTTSGILSVANFEDWWQEVSEDLGEDEFAKFIITIDGNTAEFYLSLI